MRKKYHEILGVSEDASPEELKTAYRKLALKHHPDRNSGDKESEEKFKDINEAYHALLNSTEDETADEMGFNHPFANQYGDSRTSYWSFSWSNRGTVDAAYMAEAVAIIALQEAYRGGEVSVDYIVAGKCSHCAALSDKTSCIKCGGIGTEQVKRNVKFKYPPGVDSGAVFHIKDHGHYNPMTEKHGILQVRIHVADEPTIKRKGLDLIQIISLDIPDLLLGTTVEFDSFSGRIKIEVPPLSPNGWQYLVRGAGMRANGMVGNLYIFITMGWPEELTPKQKKAVESWKKANKASPVKTRPVELKPVPGMN